VSLGTDAQLIPQEIDLPLTSQCIEFVNGMAEVQAIEKHADIKTCADLGKAFTLKMMYKYQQYDEMHIVIDIRTELNQSRISRKVSEDLVRLQRNIR